MITQLFQIIEIKLYNYFMIMKKLTCLIFKIIK